MELRTTRKGLLTIAALMSTGALILSACSSSPAPATSAPATSEPATSAPATSAPATSEPATSAAPATTAPPASSGLTIYTGRDQTEVDNTVKAFEAAFPQYAGKVQTVIAGAQDNLDRLRAEKANPQAGFLWGGTLQQFQQAASEGLLAPYQMKNANLIADGRKDPNGLWYAEQLLPEVIVYNNTMLTPQTAPQDWSDLGDPKWKDQIIIRDVMPSGTMRTIFTSLVYQFYAKDGKPDAGYDLLRAIDRNTVSYAANPDDMYQQLDSGVGSITLWNLQDALIQPLKNGRPWAYVMPKSGAPILLDGVGIVNNPSQQQAAQDFMDFLMEPGMQAQLAKDYFQIPAMELPTASKPDWLAALNIVEMKIDWDVFGKNQDEWMTYWADNIKGKG
jgi:iron(III) transport system substrate-binding protein